MIRFSKYFFQDESNDYFGKRYEYSNFIVKKYWKNHSVYFIENSSWYDDIEQQLINHKTRFPNKHIIIMQTEEDWFYDHDIIDIRKKIANSQAWTSESFLITNSNLDYKISKRYIKTFYKPGLLDLIAYKPYKKTKVDLTDFNKIKYHTSVTYRNPRHGRDEIVNKLAEHKDKCSLLHYLDHTLVDNVESKSVKQPYFMDAPFVHIDYDIEWAQHTAFITAVETFNPLGNNSIHRLMPTLSEKTFKAMHLQRPALIFGGKGTRYALRKLGFDTWDWFINWKFDTIDDPFEAFETYLLELDRLLNIDIETQKFLIIKNADRLKKNKNRLFYILNNYQKDF